MRKFFPIVHQLFFIIKKRYCGCNGVHPDTCMYVENKVVESFFFYSGPPPGLSSQHSDLGHSNSDEHVESTRVNVINGEMVIIRNSIFQDAGNTTVSSYEIFVISEIEGILTCSIL